jgi:hypothetical protein
MGSACWRCPRGPGEAACFGELAGELVGDQAAYRVGVFGGQLRIYPALDFDSQGAAGPARPGVRVDDSRHRPRGGLGRGDHVRVDAVGQAVHDIFGDLVSDVADESGDRQPGYWVAPGLAEGDSDQARERSGRGECI